MKGWKDIKAVRFEFKFTSYEYMGASPLAGKFPKAV